MINQGQVLSQDNLNKAFVSKTATGTQILLGSLSLQGGITAVGNITAATFIGAHSGNGSALTALNGTNISTGTVADARLSTNVMLLSGVQTISGHKTFNAAANLYFAGGTNYWINYQGSAKFNALNVDGLVTFNGSSYLTFSTAGVSAPTGTTASAGSKILLYGSEYSMGIETSSIWYDANANHKFYTNAATTASTLRMTVSTTGTTIEDNLIVKGNTTLGDAATDTVTFEAKPTFKSDVYFANGTTYSISSVGNAILNGLTAAGSALFKANVVVDNGTTSGSTLSIGNLTAWGKVEAPNKLYLNYDNPTKPVDIGKSGSALTFTVFGNQILAGTLSVSGLATFTGGITTPDSIAIGKNLEVQGEIKADIENEFPDPLLASGDIGLWGKNAKAGSVTLAFDGVQVPTGVGAFGSLKLTGSSTNTDGYASYEYFFDVSPSEWISFSAYIFATTAGTNSWVGFRFFDAAKAFISMDGGVVVPSISTSWSRRSWTAISPANARYVLIHISNFSANAIQYYSGFQFERGRAVTGFSPYSGANSSTAGQAGIAIAGTKMSPTTFGEGILNLWTDDALSGRITSKNNPGISLMYGSNAITVGNSGTMTTMAGRLKIGSANNLGLEVSDGTAMTVWKDTNEQVGITGASARLALVSTLAGAQGSSISLKEATASTLTNTWGISRTKGTASKLYFSYGTLADTFANPVQMAIQSDGKVGMLGVFAPEVSLAIGDTDTGLNWTADGAMQIYSNNQNMIAFAAGATIGLNKPTTVNSTLTVAGASTFNSTITTTGAVTINRLSSHLVFQEGGVGKWHLESASNWFHIIETGVLSRFNIAPGGATTINGHTTINGSATVTGAAYLSSTLAVTGNASFSSAVTFSNAPQSPGLNVIAADGEGISFWMNPLYKIYMATTTNGAWGGSVSTAATSDYNMYFRMAGAGTNRGFVFTTAAGHVVQIENSGKIHAKGGAKITGDADITGTLSVGSFTSNTYGVGPKYKMQYNATEDSLDFVYG